MARRGWPLDSPVRILPLHRDTPEAWGLIPAALARVRLFAQKYDADTDGDTLCEAIRLHFIQPDDKCKLRVLVAVRDAEVVGHLVVSVDPWCGRFIAHIVQYEMNRGARVPRVDLRRALEQAMCWAESCGATTLRVLARIDERGQGTARARAFGAFYGFRAHRIVMDRDLHPSQETT